MSISFSKMWFDETYAACESAISTVENRHLDNPFFREILTALKTGSEELRYSIAFHEQKDLVKKSGLLLNSWVAPPYITGKKTDLF